MADSRFGNIFDVAVAGAGLASMSNRAGERTNIIGSRSNAKSQASRAYRTGPLFSNYRMAVLLGPINMTTSLKEELLAFVNAGGTALVAAGVVGPNDHDLTGILLSPQLRVGRAWQWTSPAAARPVGVHPEVVFEPFRYVPLAGPVPGNNCTVLAQTASNGNVCRNDAGRGIPCPLLVRHEIGLGAVFTVLIPWMADALNNGLSKLAVDALELLIQPLQPVKTVGPWPVDVHVAVDSAAGLYTMAIANNDEAPWSGQVCLQDTNVMLSSCKELWSDKPVGVADGRTLNWTITGFDLVVLECTTVPVA
jgi:hypothetical protein